MIINYLTEINHHLNNHHQSNNKFTPVNKFLMANHRVTQIMDKLLIEIKILDSLWLRLKRKRLLLHKVIVSKNIKTILEINKEKWDRLIKSVIVHTKKQINQFLKQHFWKDMCQVNSKIYLTLQTNLILKQDLLFIILLNWGHKYLSKMNTKQHKNLQTSSC